VTATVAASTYDQGDAYQLPYTLTAADPLFTNWAGVTVTTTITKPDGTPDTPTVTPGTPVANVRTYLAVGSCSQPGTWTYRFVTTGALTESEDGQFYVEPLVTDRVYTTLPEIKSALQIPLADTSLDAVFTSAILAVSREVDQHTGRHFYKLTEARTLVPTDRYCLKLGGFNDLVSLTTLKTDASGDGTFETTWQAGDYQLLCADGSPNVNAGPEARPYTQIRAIGAQTFPVPYSWTGRTDRVEITGTWGWPQVPVNVREACKLLAVESGKLLREAPFGVAGFGEFGVVRVRDNRKAMQYLAPYRRGLAAVPVA
jgi:hypothetical protein